MTTIEDIEKAIAKLSPEQLAELRDWFDEFQARLFDEQIERDAKSGKLDDMIARARENHNAGRREEFEPLGLLSPYRGSQEELTAIDEALEQVRRGELASQAEVDAAFARFGRVTSVD